MSNLLIGVLGALVATNQPAALSDLVNQTTGVSVAAVETNITAVETNSPEEQELSKIEEDDDAAAAEVDGWIRENQQFTAKGAGIPNAELNRRIRERFDVCKKEYEDFIKRHPRYAQGRIAYASLLNDLGDEDGEYEQLLKARDIDPSIPAVWNNLGNYYGEYGPITNAFICYEKAIRLDPTESIYYQNFGTTVFLFRKDVKEYYHINEQQVFDKALTLYSNSMKFDPTNFPLATDVAETYYGITPFRTNDALLSWSNALKLAQGEVEREGVYVHLARINIKINRLALAQQFLDEVTNSNYGDLKNRLQRNLNEKAHPQQRTNAPAAAPVVQVVKTNSPAASH